MGLQQLEAMVHDTAKAGEPFERGADQAELDYLATLATRPGTQLICEVGFNAGFSTWAFLGASPSTVVFSFDLANYSYSANAKAHVDELFPGLPTQAWREAVDAGVIVHQNYFRDGEPVDIVEPPANRAWAEGSSF